MAVVEILVRVIFLAVVVELLLLAPLHLALTAALVVTELRLHLLVHQ
jgi:hypothetical protein